MAVSDDLDRTHTLGIAESGLIGLTQKRSQRRFLRARDGPNQLVCAYSF